jgi:hypothetical protein
MQLGCVIKLNVGMPTATYNCFIYSFGNTGSWKINRSIQLLAAKVIA